VALDNDGLRTADYDMLFKTIARGRYDTAMAGWHMDEGGVFNDYQIDQLVALIRYVDWPEVGEMAAQRGLIPPSQPVPTMDDALFTQVAALGEAGVQWAEGYQLYARQCTICHGINGEGSELAVALNTPETRALSSDELARIIREGVPGTLMVGWDQVVDEAEIDALVAFLQNWEQIDAAGLTLTPPEPIHIDITNPDEMLALGERLFATTCVACHGEEGSGGMGPALNSQQFLTRQSDEQIRSTIINGGHRPNSAMPAFGDRLTSVELDALVQFIRGWEPTAPWVENPRGTAQGGGPPWLRATPDAANPVQPNGGPSWGRSGANGTPAGTPANAAAPAEAGPATVMRGEVVALESNALTFRRDDGVEVQAMLGPPWYWPDNGIALAPGDLIELEGFDSADHMEVNWIRNLTTGAEHQLRTPEGMPVWQGTR
jgi:mono/diheme cytochrome c family protein